MSKNIIALVLILLLSGVGYTFYHIKNSKEYLTDLTYRRNEKDAWFSSNLNSPFIVTQTPFHKLNYYDANRDFIINAELFRNYNFDTVRMSTSTNEIQSYRIYGTASFKIDGIPCTVQLFYQNESNDLFLPFQDLTSGNETYGAGRYLEADAPTEDKVILDFNNAYNPYCAYMDSYSCPFPPKANVLAVAIKAGEKNYH